VARDYVKIPKEFLNSTRRSLTADIFFCEQDPIFLDDESKDMFTAVNHRDRTVPQIHILVGDIVHYLQRGFRITTVPLGEFRLSPALIESVRWPMVNPGKC
jgi:hypothetical protein